MNLTLRAMDGTIMHQCDLFENEAGFVQPVAPISEAFYDDIDVACYCHNEGGRILTDTIGDMNDVPYCIWTITL